VRLSLRSFCQSEFGIEHPISASTSRLSTVKLNYRFHPKVFHFEEKALVIGTK
jgi:hypothetical protein